MSARILDGAALAATLREELRPRVAAFTARTGRPPGLGIVLVGTHAPSEIYVRNKLKAASDIGCRADLVRLPEIRDAGGSRERRARAEPEPVSRCASSYRILCRRRSAARRRSSTSSIRQRTWTGSRRSTPVCWSRIARPWCRARHPGVIELLERSAIAIARPARGRHRPQRHRRQADGAAAAAPARHRDDLSFADGRFAVDDAAGRHPRRRSRTDGVRAARAREAWRGGHRRRDQPRDRSVGGRGALSRAAHRGEATSTSGARSWSATCILLSRRWQAPSRRCPAALVR